MAITHDVDFGGAQGTTSASTSNNTPSGSGLIIAMIVNNGGTISSITDTFGNSYTIQQLGDLDGAGLDIVTLAYAQNSSVVSGHVTVATTAGTCVIGATHIRGLATSAPLDRTAFANSGGANGTALDSGATAARQFSNEILIGLGTQATGASIAWTPGSGFITAVTISAGGVGRVMLLEYKIVSATGTDHGLATSDTSAKWGMGIATFSDTGIPGVGGGNGAQELLGCGSITRFPVTSRRRRRFVSGWSQRDAA